ncbi:PHP domain-containing protein [Janibacter hoylei PVAS-1]|uniref:PHP domain-containing protein n=1 Tax=Janibacter hoylei PVAS-1 TaxID=1210046 RepID=K1DUG9_9MICO|nr:PHP domain-containing protein [Janibacter hoylei PVAS-1]
MIDLHTHSSRSDGTDAPAELLRQAVEGGLTTLAITDHDTTAGWEEAAEAAAHYGVALVRGAELSTRHRGRSVHLLAYLFDPADQTLAEEMRRMREDRVPRLRRIVEHMAEDGFAVTWEDVLAQVEEGGRPRPPPPGRRPRRQRSRGRPQRGLFPLAAQRVGLLRAALRGRHDRGGAPRAGRRRGAGRGPPLRDAAPACPRRRRRRPARRRRARRHRGRPPRPRRRRTGLRPEAGGPARPRADGQQRLPRRRQDQPARRKHDVTGVPRAHRGRRRGHHTRPALSRRRIDARGVRG